MLFPSIVQWTKRHLRMASCIGFLASPMCFAQTPTEKSVQDSKTKKVANHTVNENAIQVDPEYIGGKIALMSYLQKNLRYPENALLNGLEGTVIVRFFVTAEGNVEQVKVIKGFNTDCDTEAVRVVQNMGKWKPGTVDGKNIYVPFKLPITFKLSKPLPGAY
jgi:periplasmic protein TonB